MVEKTYKAKTLEAWSRFIVWVNLHQPIARMAIITVVMIGFLLFLPAYIKTYFWHGLQSHRVLTAMLLIFILLSVSLVWSAGQRLDTRVFLLLNLRGSRPLWLDRLMLVFTQVGSGFFALGLALLLYLFGPRLLSYELMLGTLSLWMIVEMVKFLVNRSRPFIHLTQARILGFRAIGRSFPSGHTSQAFFMATLVSQHFHANAWVVLVLYVLALTVGITRMYVGAHYPRDVLAGAILGSVWGFLGVIVEGYYL
jgi:membrane-associated phospholipid phosphatase